MTISLAWLVYCYIQKLRYDNEQDRNEISLEDTTKEAIGLLQVRTIKEGDKVDLPSLSSGSDSPSTAAYMGVSDGKQSAEDQALGKNF
ncbi:hypothetical protein NHX12_017891 [Muraenolepis orangiensis]|uniref:Uncharacterized protein n=1 Tax=Muraenolepis orangiensis TaxID=630683 RepID=A0A9Q0EVF3_9TELE|nr:hypothetical protein NHX12_017891 [Muraenolepis orangiensis]